MTLTDAGVSTGKQTADSAEKVLSPSVCQNTRVRLVGGNAAGCTGVVVGAHQGYYVVDVTDGRRLHVRRKHLHTMKKEVLQPRSRNRKRSLATALLDTDDTSDSEWAPAARKVGKGTAQKEAKRARSRVRTGPNERRRQKRSVNGQQMRELLESRFSTLAQANLAGHVICWDAFFGLSSAEQAKLAEMLPEQDHRCASDDAG